MKVLVTGATGFIGSHLVRRLVKEGYRVRALVRKQGYISELESQGVEIFLGDILKPSTIEGVTRGIDVVFHLVGGGKVSTGSKRGFDKLWTLNVTGTENILRETVKDGALRKFIHFSSISAIGIKKNGEVISENTPCTPETPHEMVKYEGEIKIRDYHNRYGLNYVILRPSQVYGPEDIHSEILNMLKLIKKGLFPVFGDGRNYMVPFIYVEDLVTYALLTAKSDKANNKTFILAGPGMSVNEVIDEIGNVLGKKSVRVHIPKNLALAGVFILESVAKTFFTEPLLTRKRIEAMTANRVYDTTKAQMVLGCEPHISLSEGMKIAIDWYRGNGYL